MVALVIAHLFSWAFDVDLHNLDEKEGGRARFWGGLPRRWVEREFELRLQSSSG